MHWRIYIYRLIIFSSSFLWVPTAQIKRKSPIDLCRVIQLQTPHHVNKFLSSHFEFWIETFLFLYCGRHATIVVVCRIHNAIRGESEKLRVDIVIEHARVSFLKISSSTTSDQKSITGEDDCVIIKKKTEASLCDKVRQCIHAY